MKRCRSIQCERCFASKPFIVDEESGTPGSGVYQLKQREQWLHRLTESGLRQRVEWLYEELDHLRSLRKRAKLAMLTESRKHRAFSLLRTIPQLGPIRCALIVATLDTPHRFRTQHQLWAYSGLAVVTHTSSEYEIKAGRVVRSRKPISTSWRVLGVSGIDQIHLEATLFEYLVDGNPIHSSRLHR